MVWYGVPRLFLPLTNAKYLKRNAIMLMIYERDSKEWSFLWEKALEQGWS